MPASAEITQLLERAAAGEGEAREELAARVYRELERYAEHQLKVRYGPELAGLTLEPAALVNETFLRLLQEPMRFGNRRHFFGFASKVMLSALVDYQRRRGARKRGGDLVRVTLTGLDSGDAAPQPGIEELTQRFDELAGFDERKAEVVKLRLLWGFENREIAEILEVSERTVERDWRFSRNWLRSRLTEGPPAVR
jgi:RNA polymerase sigma factor (TIGR02999 family)